jgi:hypothetical protein
MSDAQIRGTVHMVDDTKTYGQNGFRKRLIVIEQDNGRFTNYIPLEFIQDGCDTVDGVNVGDELEVSYRLSGRKWQRDASSEVKYFLNAEALDFKVLKTAVETVAAEAGSQQAEDYIPDDDVPF